MAVSFEEFIIQACKAEERGLRRWMRKVLPRYGFEIQEDDYVGYRAKKDDSYKEVHNMLAIRGKKPKVCLVAHTDICRDHDHQIDYSPKGTGKGLRVNPVIKTAELEEDNGKVIKRVIQDKTCNVQVGGDDRLGVAINTWIALNTGHDMGLLFTTDEEKGLVSAREVKFKELRDFELCAQVDRGNNSDELVTKIHGTSLCDYETAVRCLEIAFDIGMARKPVNGAGTDVLALKERGIIKNAVNMTCGYHHSFGASGHEYIDIDEAKATLHYVSSIIKDYNLN